MEKSEKHFRVLILFCGHENKIRLKIHFVLHFLFISGDLIVLNDLLSQNAIFQVTLKR